MEIEYQDEFNELQEKDTFRGQQWFGERQRLVEKYAWAVPNTAAIVYLSGFERLLEVGAGNGYWANLINENDGSVKATDIDPPEDTYTDVISRSVQDLREDIEGDAVLMVWPPSEGSMTRQVAMYQPNHILYVGEPRGGCTASDEFFDIIEGTYGLVAKIDIPSYAGINDDLFHYIRKV